MAYKNFAILIVQMSNVKKSTSFKCLRFICGCILCIFFPALSFCLPFMFFDSPFPVCIVLYYFIFVLVFVFKAARSHMNRVLKSNFFNHSLLQLRMLFSRGLCQGKTQGKKMIGLLMQLNVVSAGRDEKSRFYQILSNELLSVVQSQSTDYNLEKLNCSSI